MQLLGYNHKYFISVCSCKFVHDSKLILLYNYLINILLILLNTLHLYKFKITEVYLLELFLLNLAKEGEALYNNSLREFVSKQSKCPGLHF